MGFNVHGLGQKQSAADDPFAQAIIEIQRERGPDLDALRTELEGYENTIENARGAADEMVQLGPLVGELENLILRLGQYLGNHDIQALKERASRTHDDLVAHCFELFKQQIEGLPEIPPLGLYFDAYEAIMGSEAFSPAQRTLLVTMLDDHYEVLRSEIEALRQQAPEHEGPPPDTYSAAIDPDHKTESENDQRVSVIRGSWDELFVHGIWRQLAVEQIQRALDNNGSEDAIHDAAAIIDQADAADRETIAHANDAAADLPPNVIEDSGYMVPRLEDMITTPLAEIGVEPPAAFTADAVPFERQQLMRDIGDAAVEGYAAYLREKMASIRSTGDTLLASISSEIMERAPTFIVEFDIFADLGHVTGAIATPTYVEISQEGAYFPVEEIAQSMIETIGQDVRMPCYMHFIRITLKFEVDSNEVTATIVE
jgi:hypothetical protein